jgi:hypothetical protein
MIHTKLRGTAGKAITYVVPNINPTIFKCCRAQHITIRSVTSDKYAQLIPLMARSHVGYLYATITYANGLDVVDPVEHDVSTRISDTGYAEIDFIQAGSPIGLIGEYSIKITAPIDFIADLDIKLYA